MFMPFLWEMLLGTVYEWQPASNPDICALECSVCVCPNACILLGMLPFRVWGDSNAERLLG